MSKLLEMPVSEVGCGSIIKLNVRETGRFMIFDDNEELPILRGILLSTCLKGEDAHITMLVVNENLSSEYVKVKLPTKNNNVKVTILKTGHTLLKSWLWRYDTGCK